MITEIRATQASTARSAGQLIQISPVSATPRTSRRPAWRTAGKRTQVTNRMIRTKRRSLAALVHVSLTRWYIHAST